ncbi:MAG: TolB family protein [Chitinophagaceae bacterium]
MSIKTFLFCSFFIAATSLYAQPTIFEPTLISNNEAFGLTISPDGKELFFVKSFGGRDTLHIYTSYKKGNKWTTPTPATFNKPFLKQIDPTFSPNGKFLFFNVMTGNQFDVYVTQKTPKGWSEPQLLSGSVNTTENEFYATPTKKGDLYFTRRTKSNDIYVSKFANGQYEQAIKLDSTINTDFNESNPFISEKGDYLIFFSDRDKKQADTDLYISFLNNNKWSIPQVLDSSINSSMGEFCPFVHKKSNTFYFARTMVINGRRIENIYTYPLRKLGLNKLRKKAQWR